MDIDGEINGYTFQWKIENISHCCWLTMKEPIESPVFKTHALEGTEWSLRLFPMRKDYENFVALFLLRKDCIGPTVIEVTFQLAFLSKDGSILTEKFENHGFRSKHCFGPQNFESRERIFFTEREEFLPEDTFTVKCTLWKKEESLVKVKPLYARTVFKINRNRFVWKIVKFSKMKPGLRKTLKDNIIAFDLILNKGKDKKLDLDMISIDNSIKYISFNILIIDSEGKKKNLGIPKYFANDLKKRVLSSMILLPEVLMRNKSLYLPNNVLTLDFEFIYSTETKFIEFSDLETISTTLEMGLVDSSELKSSILTKDLVKNVEKNCIVKESQNTTVLIDDLKSMFYDGIFSDTQIHTLLQTFPAHRNILSTRSPVFREMFMEDMNEKKCGHIDISDFDDDTVHRMLLYMYTDILEDLKFESACKLYVAADKFEVISLKNECSSFLKDNLCPTKACDVLILAEQHQDENLKSAVRAYILKHDEVFSLLEWENFMVSNLKLAADIMYKKVNPGKIYPGSS